MCTPSGHVQIYKSLLAHISTQFVLYRSHLLWESVHVNPPHITASPRLCFTLEGQCKVSYEWDLHKHEAFNLNIALVAKSPLSCLDTVEFLFKFVRLLLKSALCSAPIEVAVDRWEREEEEDMRQTDRTFVSCNDETLQTGSGARWRVVTWPKAQEERSYEWVFRANTHHVLICRGLYTLVLSLIHASSHRFIICTFSSQRIHDSAF